MLSTQLEGEMPTEVRTDAMDAQRVVRTVFRSCVTDHSVRPLVSRSPQRCTKWVRTIISGVEDEKNRLREYWSRQILSNSLHPSSAMCSDGQSTAGSSDLTSTSHSSGQ